MKRHQNNPDFSIGIRFRRRGYLCSICWWGVQILFWLALTAHAQFGDEVPPLEPARPEMPPTLWEQFGLMFVVVVVGFHVLVGLLIWWVVKPRPRVPVPIAVQARRELAALREHPQDSRTLSAISRTVRRYFLAAFQLPADEVTTADFSRLLLEQKRIGAELVGCVVGFLQECDVAKFAPKGGGSPGDSIARALDLVEQGERRRAEIARIAPGQQSGAA